MSTEAFSLRHFIGIVRVIWMPCTPSTMHVVGLRSSTTFQGMKWKGMEYWNPNYFGDIGETLISWWTFTPSALGNWQFRLNHTNLQSITLWASQNKTTVHLEIMCSSCTTSWCLNYQWSAIRSATIWPDFKKYNYKCISNVACIYWGIQQLKWRLDWILQFEKKWVNSLTKTP